MKIWLSKSSEVPVQEQLRVQVILGIVSADLTPGERLPSTSQLARQFRLHPNTIRAAYRGLANHGWIEWRQGSGFYVRVFDRGTGIDASFDLDRLISGFYEVARTRGHTLNEIQSRILRWLSSKPPNHVLVIEPESELRKILVAEIKAQLNVNVIGFGMDVCSQPGALVGAACVALYDHAEQIRALLSPEISCSFMHSRSIPKTLAGEAKPGPDTLFIVISRWPDFLRWARTTLVAVGIDPSALDLRDARHDKWQRGLTSSSFVITDSLIATQLPSGCQPHVFKLIADDSIAALRDQLHAPDRQQIHPE